MSSKKQHATPDPELLRQVDAAAGDKFVEAVFSLRPTGTKAGLESAHSSPTPEEFESLTRDVLARVEKEAGVAPARVSVYRSLGSCAVSAQPQFIRKLMAQEEVVSATASRQTEDMLIRPKGPARAGKGKRKKTE